MFKADADKLFSSLNSKQYNIRSMLSRLPMGTVITNKQGIIVYYNKAQSHIDSLPSDFTLGKKESEIYDFLDFPDIAQICQKRGRPILGFVWLYRTIYGKTINAAYWVFPILNENEKVIGSICFTQPLSAVLSGKEQKERHQPIEWPEKTPITYTKQDIIGENKTFQIAMRMAKSTAKSPSPVLISGETGTGKEIFARLIHNNSQDKNRPFIAINCAAIPHELLEGLLFGTTKGSFTGAINRAGMLEEANGGTLYLDEIDSMPLQLQPKLLRVLQEMKINRLGSVKEYDLNLKVISSISSSVNKMLEQKKIRPDLFYRLSVVSLEIPPLTSRLDDLEALINYFINKYNLTLNKNAYKFSEELLQQLYEYAWPGNVRELENLIAGSINLINNNENVLDFQHLPMHYRHILRSKKERKIYNNTYFLEDSSNKKFAENNDTNPSNITSNLISKKEEKNQDNNNTESLKNSIEGLKKETALKEFEKIKNALKASEGNVAQAARSLGISRQLLSYKMKKHDIKRQNFLNFI